MAQWQEDLEEGQQQAGFGGAVGAMAWETAKWQYGYSSLHMIRDGARAGYYVPWTRVVAGQNNRVANIGTSIFGRPTGWWGPEGLGANVIKPNLPVQGIFERQGIRGFGRASTLAAQREAGEAMAAGIAAREAGVIGARAATVGGTKYLAGRIAGMAIPVINFLTTAGFVVDTAKGLWGFASKTFGKPNYLEMGGNFQDSQAGYTSRQRALQAITSSQMQARSAIGNEAMLFHRG